MHFELAQNYPNPVENETTISYALPTQCDVDLMIYDLLGHRIATLVDETQSPGRKTTTWDSAEYPSGVYVYKLSAGGKVFAKRMTVVR